MATQKPNYRDEKIVPFTRDDLILERLSELKAGQNELRQEIKEVRRELNERIDRLENRMDRFDTELRNVARHSQMMTASVIGIALAVIYFVCTH